MARSLSTTCRFFVATALFSSAAGLVGCASGGEAETSSNGGNAGDAGAGGDSSGGNGGTGATSSGGSGGSDFGGFAGMAGEAGAGGSGGFGGFGGVGGSAGAGGSSAGSAGTGGTAGSGGVAGSGGSTGVPEVCDGLDNNGNGQIDEGDPGGGAPCNVAGEQGECAKGTLHCVSSQLRCQADNVASAEVCDGLDNDCDGSVDEGNPEGGQACNTGLDGICALGATRCDTSAMPHRVVCDPNVTPGTQMESCNSLDDDCDGQPDEGNPGGNQACTISSLKGPCAAGRTNCVTGQLDCEQQTFPTSELCDGIDNDCDGMLDNAPSGQSLPGVGAACSVSGAQGECAIGTQSCSGGGFQCNPTFTSRAERCDAKDNDCDGSNDEDSARDMCTRKCWDSGDLAQGAAIPDITSSTLQCNAGVCELTQANCPPGRRDNNGDICDGCESTVCNTTSDISASCSSPTTLTGTRNGQIVTLNGSLYFTVPLSKPNPASDQGWNPTVTLSAQSKTNGYRMDVISNCSNSAVSCPQAGGTGSGTGSNITQWSMNYAASRNVNCALGGATHCTDNSNPPGTLIIKITRTSIPGSGSNPECNQFTVTFTE